MDPRREYDPALEELLRWDTLPASRLRELERDPQGAARLELLRKAERWLESANEQGAEQMSAPAGASSPCPDADELYDYSRGPGYQVLAEARRLVLDEHLASCAECTELTATLATSPPVPIFSPAESQHAGPTPVLPGIQAPAGNRPRLVSARSRWVPILAAASVMAAGILSWRAYDASAARGHFPSAALMRGADSGALVGPRGRVLALEQADTRSVALAGLFALQPSFEITPVPRAESYRVRVLRHDGTAFSAGREVFAADSDAPTLAHDLIPVTPGHYTWEAWAVVDGLERALGAHDFTIDEDEETRAELVRLWSAGRASEAVRWLHDRGYRCDARGLALELPQSKERDAYLDQSPGH